MQQTQSPTSKVSFVLQLGYFRILTRFYPADQFDPILVDWLSRQLRVDAVK